MGEKDMSEFTMQDTAKIYLANMAREINAINRANGWDVPEKDEFGNPDKKWVLTGRLMLVVTEIAEAVEAFRKGDAVNFNEEFADIFIRMLSMVDGYEMDIIEEIITKMAVNKLRAKQHGGKAI
jgi:NTP pyrophosphatase (non-canonical NTP hydrolase)